MIYKYLKGLSAVTIRQLAVSNVVAAVTVIEPAKSFSLKHDSGTIILRVALGASAGHAL